MTVEHRLMAYFSSDGEKYLPVMDCTCGFDTGRCDSFAEAGEMVDEHLASLASSPELLPTQLPKEK